jgi:hypothetical protein
MSPISIPGGLSNTVFVPAATSIDPAPRQMARNGLHPTASYAHRLRAIANNLARYRTKQVACFAPFTGPSWADAHPSSRVRWRSYFHSSPYVSELRVVLSVFRQDFTDAFGPPTNPAYVVVECRTTAGTLVGSLTLSGGPAPSQFPDDFLFGPENIFYRFGVLLDATGVPAAIPASTDLQLTITEQNYALVLGCAIFEESSAADTANGYVDPTVHVSTPITSNARKDVADILRAVWTHGGGHLISWSRLLDSTGAYNPFTIASGASPTNVVDGTSTAVNAASPGFTLDLSNNLRLVNPGGSPGVTISMAVYGKCTSAGNGVVRLFRSGTVGIVTASGFATTLGWVVASGFALSSVDKFDILASTAAGTLTVEAASVWIQDQ